MANWIRLRVVPAILFLVLAAQLVAAAAPLVWGTPENISVDTLDFRSASIAIDHQGRTHAVWSDGVSIYHRILTGETWSGRTTVTAGSSPHLVAGPALVYMAYGDSLLGGENRVNWMTWSLAEGWKVAPPVSDSEGNLSLAPKVAVAQDGGLAVVWSEPSGDAPLIYLARSDDGSAWVKSPVPDAKGSHPVVGFAGGIEPLVAWEDELDPLYAPEMEIWASRLDEGAWTLPVDLSQTFAPDSVLPSMAVTGASVSVAWQESGEEGQGVWLSENGGDGWTHPVRLSGEGGGYAPSLSGDASGGLHLVWTGGPSVVYRNRESGASEWGEQQAISSNQVEPDGAKIVASDGLHVIWLAQDDMNQEVWFSGVPSEATPEPTAEPTVGPTYDVFVPLVLRG